MKFFKTTPKNATGVSERVLKQHPNQSEPGELLERPSNQGPVMSQKVVTFQKGIATCLRCALSMLLI